MKMAGKGNFPPFFRKQKKLCSVELWNFRTLEVWRCGRENGKKTVIFLLENA
jgi:hypothetical protein